MKKLLILIFLSLQLFAYDRIIALSPSINEIIYALNSGDKIVGNTDFCNYPKDAKNKTKVGGFFSPNLEKIIALKPDMVIMQNSSLKLSKKLKRLGIKTTIIKNRTIDDIKNSIKTIGNVLNKKDKADKIVQNIDSELINLKNIIKDKKILIVIGHNTSLDKRIFVAGQNLYFDDIINTSGNKNAYQSSLKGQPVLNLENIIATNPDIVILLSPYRIKKGLSKKELIAPWINIPINAKKQKNIYIVDGEYAGIPSQRIIHFLDDFKNFLEDVRSKKL
jgi:iron complex transport system substrate-binding protein